MIYDDYCDISHEQCAHFGELGKLRTLIIFCEDISLTALIEVLVKNCVPIEYLQLYAKCESEITIDLPTMKMLKTIRLNNISDEVLINLAKTQPTLEEIDSGEYLSNITVWGIKKALQYGKNLLFLDVLMDKFSEIDLDDNESIKARGRVAVQINHPRADLIKVPLEIVDANHQWVAIIECDIDLSS